MRSLDVESAQNWALSGSTPVGSYQHLQPEWSFSSLRRPLLSMIWSTPEDCLDLGLDPSSETLLGAQGVPAFMQAKTSSEPAWDVDVLLPLDLACGLSFSLPDELSELSLQPIWKLIALRSIF